MQKHINEIYFSQLLGKRIYDNDGKQIGKVKDCVVLWDGDMPRVTGIRHTDDMDKLGKQLNTAQSTYHDSMKKLNSGTGNLVSRAENIKALGAKANKSLPKTSFTEES